MARIALTFSKDWFSPSEQVSPYIALTGPRILRAKFEQPIPFTQVKPRCKPRAVNTLRATGQEIFRFGWTSRPTV